MKLKNFIYKFISPFVSTKIVKLKKVKFLTFIRCFLISFLKWKACCYERFVFQLFFCVLFTHKPVQYSHQIWFRFIAFHERIEAFCRTFKKHCLSLFWMRFIYAFNLLLVLSPTSTNSYNLVKLICSDWLTCCVPQNDFMQIYEMRRNFIWTVATLFQIYFMP